MRYIKGRWIPAPKGRQHFGIRLKHLICISLLLVLMLAVVSEIALNSVTQELTEEATRQHMAESVSKAVEKRLKSTKSGEFSIITQDISGKILSVQGNAKELNLFKAGLTEDIQKRLSGTAKVAVPIGSFTGVGVFNGRGFSVPLKMSFQSDVNVSFESDIVSAGINQSCHRIYIKVSAQVYSQSKSFSAGSHYETDFILSETVIVGEVPEFVTGLRAK